MTHAVVTGGGTSGHVLPALAIMDRLVAAGHDPGELHYIGTDRGIETRLLPPTGYGHTFLDVIGLQRALTRRNLAVVPKLIRATRRAGRLLGELRPAVVVNVGGYASMPATLAAFRAKIPVVVVSYDLRPGLVSKLAARRATAVAAAFAASPLPDTRLTGAPIRPEIIAVDRIAGRAAARAELDLPDDRFVVAVFGGSLGAKAINTAVAGLVAAWEADGSGSDVCIHHVVGDRWLVEAPPSRDGRAGIMYRVIGYEDRMPQLYAAADLMITRAGASTIAELAATGTPGIVVPWPGAAENHQLDNARTLTDIGAAVLLEESELSAASLAALVRSLHDDPARLRAIGAAARAEGERHRGDSLIRLIDDVAAGRADEVTT
ncbi:MAG: UDP-N-acetylglucosamine--N-acetylmuramyl-(pentapeptide) pyrophosphoryl-undecaprenol N-acetylglucosamine transferase [Acidimicrobiales bacterium]|nr:UDP-N-acetylglucosamine--N-acetylmuramyl-(pentapeptide) pyrophosphoryl-undecaprenol N-acetylglucosamine transferase [Acidimicrobiales bacterium]MCB9394449.1 UDP-N-acetylglucosamine--N-acetylmuramyl-(pentapeptide) pyrophosphoryl-undecaprenol N-acetylglucosamine transferase [Acidimicrobiaceae bacterium]